MDKTRSLVWFVVIWSHGYLVSCNCTFYAALRAFQRFISSIEEFHLLIDAWKLKPENGETKDHFPWKITEGELESLRKKVISELYSVCGALLLVPYCLIVCIPHRPTDTFDFMNYLLNILRTHLSLSCMHNHF